MNYHGRYIHIQIASEDNELIWHVHPDDFYDITTTGSGTIFWVNAVFPRAGKYYIGASFLFRNGTRYREGAASDEIVVGGAVPMHNATFNYTSINYFQSYPIDSTDRIYDPIDTQTNLASEFDGIKVIFQIVQQVGLNNHTHTGGMIMTTGGMPQQGLSSNPPDNDNIYLYTCVPFYLQVFMNGTETPATSLIPYLRAPVHFSMVSPDGGVYHAHGSYIPDGVLFNDLAGMVAAHSGMNMTDEEMMNDPMMNLTMNALMMGIQPNGTVNCESDAGVIMEFMPEMDHSRYYGPEHFGPVIVGLFDWPAYGDWRVFAWMKIEINGVERLIVPHFSVKTVLQPEDHHHESISGASGSFLNGYIYLLSVILSMGLLF